ncbi:MAG: hypothetical protein K2G47_07880 [Muribaculum sp.]|nr:hypothetical protein [Muribaculum sp.]
MMKGISLLISSTIALSMSGCFTGIESTPKITADEVKRQQVTVSDEERFLKEIAPQQLSKWERGKLFYVTDDKISLALEPGSTGYPKAGEYISYQSFHEIPSMTGKPDTELTFIDSNGNEVRYRIAATADELDKRRKIEIPFTIETSVVDEVKEALVGNTYYVRTATWFDENGSALRGEKFIPVKIIDITPGNTVYPVKIRFATASDSLRNAFLYMSAGDQKGSRDFASLFYFENPRNRYPNITDETWANIIRGKVALYMTREECRLALGSPATVDRRPGISTMRELWTYENGIYLIFDDGILQSFRN